MRISDWSSDVCSSDLVKKFESGMVINPLTIRPDATLADALALMERHGIHGIPVTEEAGKLVGILTNRDVRFATDRSEEHTSELQSLMRISYAVFCLKKNKT